MLSRIYRLIPLALMITNSFASLGLRVANVQQQALLLASDTHNPAVLLDDGQVELFRYCADQQAFDKSQAFITCLNTLHKNITVVPYRELEWVQEEMILYLVEQLEDEMLTQSERKQMTRLKHIAINLTNNLCSYAAHKPENSQRPASILVANSEQRGDVIKLDNASVRAGYDLVLTALRPDNTTIIKGDCTVTHNFRIDGDSNVNNALQTSTIAPPEGESGIKLMGSTAIDHGNNLSVGSATIGKQHYVGELKIDNDMSQKVAISFDAVPEAGVYIKVILYGKNELDEATMFHENIYVRADGTVTRFFSHTVPTATIASSITAHLTDEPYELQVQFNVVNGSASLKDALIEYKIIGSNITAISVIEP